MREFEYTEQEQQELARCAALDNAQLIEALIDVTGYDADREAAYVAVVSELCNRLGVVMSWD